MLNAGKLFATTSVKTDFVILVVVEIEALTYHDIPDKMPLIKKFINMATILQLDSKITKKAIEIRLKYKKIKLGDVIIAATAIINNGSVLE